MKKYIGSVILIFALCTALLLGCASQGTAQTPAPTPAVSNSGGILCLKVNPEIALHYDENGIVTKLEARNRDGARILEDFPSVEGKDTAQALTELVDAIGTAGYLVEEAEGKARTITLELDPGSQVPHQQFLEDMAQHVKRCVENNAWVGEVDYDYRFPAVTESSTTGASTDIPAGLCPVCADDDCDDGAYCDDWDEKQENLREQENIRNNTPCDICGEYDCDDGAYCDDWDEKQENLREQENIRNNTPCDVCGEYDCDDGAYCDDWNDRYDD